jgi:hypothetical protein
MGVATSQGSNGSSQKFLACGLRANLTLDWWITLRVSSIRTFKVMACLADTDEMSTFLTWLRQKVTVIKLVVDRSQKWKHNRGLMSLVEPMDMWIGISSTASHHVLLSKCMPEPQSGLGWCCTVIRCSCTGIRQGSDAADVAHSAKWKCLRVK